ncbi:MAG TPA: hypothetical protein VJ044_05310, partial [Candidatus Hodarchaeales archaeon]|nr:hypothetical protein [Candidatus Hodarchaeales archaeon]
PLDNSELLALLTETSEETSEESSRLAIPEPTSQLWGVTRDSHAEYIRWRQERQYQLKHPFPPGVVISLSLARLFVSPNFKLVSHMSRDAVRGIMNTFSGILGEWDQRPTRLPNQVVMAFARSRSPYESSIWTIVYMISHDIDIDHYVIVQSVPPGTFVSEKLEGASQNFDRDFLVYGVVKPISGSMVMNPLELSSPMRQPFNLFYSDGSTTGDAEGLEIIPSQNMLNYRDMIAVIPAVVTGVFEPNNPLVSITLIKRSDKTEQKQTFHEMMSRSISVNSAIERAIDKMIMESPTFHLYQGDKFGKKMDLEVSALMEDYDVHIDVGIDPDHKFPIYESTWEGSTKHERYFIDRDAMLTPALLSGMQNYKIGPLRVFDPTTPWGKPWGYQMSFYIPAPSRYVSGLLIIPLPWLFFLYNPNIHSGHAPYISLFEYRFMLDPRIMAIHRLPGTGRILAFQPYECMFLMDQLPPEETERLALLQQPDIQERAPSQILVL